MCIRIHLSRITFCHNGLFFGFNSRVPFDGRASTNWRFLGLAWYSNDPKLHLRYPKLDKNFDFGRCWFWKIPKTLLVISNTSLLRRKCGRPQLRLKTTGSNFQHMEVLDLFNLHRMVLLRKMVSFFKHDTGCLACLWLRLWRPQQPLQGEVPVCCSALDWLDLCETNWKDKQLLIFFLRQDVLYKYLATSKGSNNINSWWQTWVLKHTKMAPHTVKRWFLLLLLLYDFDRFSKCLIRWKQ